MKYEVRKDGKVYYNTISEKPPYSKDRELSIRQAGYAIYVDGKRTKGVGKD